jgi:hypothetical protein
MSQKSLRDALLEVAWRQELLAEIEADLSNMQTPPKEGGRRCFGDDNSG